MTQQRKGIDALYQDPWPDSYRFFQLGFLVDDLQAAARRWIEVYGVGPFYFLRRAVQRHHHRGRVVEVDMQVCTSQAGPVQIELIHLFSEGPNIYRDLFPPGGTGLHQICTVTRDYDAAKARYDRLGCPVAAEIDMQGGPFRVCYVDTLRDFGVFTEVVEYTPGFLEALKRISDACADWDGTDPLRVMTRDGYRPL
ncbi:MAG: VOC family protein [Gammaproteobacteria bacterium]